MAAVAVLDPSDPNASPLALANTLDNFCSKLATSDPKVSDIPGSDFILNSEPYGKLKIYLDKVLEFPEDQTVFQRLYPATQYKKFLDTTEEPGLYNNMMNTILTLRGHCDTFRRKTITGITNLSGSIANFADDNGQDIKKIEVNMVIATDRSKKSSDPDVKEAVAAIVEACDLIISGANTHIDACIELQGDLETFRDDTKKDQIALELVNTKTDAKWPTRAKFSETLKQSSDRAYSDLAAMYKEQNDIALNKGRSEDSSFVNKIGARIYYLNYDQRDKLKALDTKFGTLWDNQLQDFQAAMEFQARSKGLAQTMDSVEKSMTDALAALDVLKGDFGQFVSDMQYARDKMSSVHTDIRSDKNSQRTVAKNNFGRARERWASIQKAARKFQQEGIKLSEKLTKQVAEESKLPDPPERLEIESANFGSLDVTQYAPAVWHMETYLRIQPTARAFSDPWPTVEKTMSCIYRVGKTDNKRYLLLCNEYTENNKSVYLIQENDPWVGADVGKAVHKVIYLQPPPSGSKIQIIAVVWGMDVIDSDESNVWRGLYDCVGKSVVMENSTFGRDTWRDHGKTGVVYFRNVEGDRAVQQISGKEGTTVAWKV